MRYIVNQPVDSSPLLPSLFSFRTAWEPCLIFPFQGFPLSPKTPPPFAFPSSSPPPPQGTLNSKKVITLPLGSSLGKFYRSSPHALRFAYTCRFVHPSVRLGSSPPPSNPHHPFYYPPHTLLLSLPCRGLLSRRWTHPDLLSLFSRSPCVAGRSIGEPQKVPWLGLKKKKKQDKNKHNIRC